MKDQGMEIAIMTETEEKGATAQEGWYYLHCTCFILQECPFEFSVVTEKGTVRKTIF